MVVVVILQIPPVVAQVENLQNKIRNLSTEIILGHGVVKVVILHALYSDNTSLNPDGL